MGHKQIKNKCWLLLLSCFFYAFFSLNNANAQYPDYRSYYDIEEEFDEEIYDPFEPVNRFMFSLNEGFYDYAGNYIVVGYRAVTTQGIRDSVVNFLDNVRSPITLFVSVVMLDHKRVGNVISRFGINTTIGILGLFDVAGQMGIKNNHDELGLAFGKWGVSPGPYIIVPFFGSYTLRSGVGDLVELAIDPLNFNVLGVGGDGPWVPNNIRNTRVGVNLLTDVDAVKDLFDKTRKDSFDPYATVRTMYLQNRKEKVRKIKEGE